MKYLKKVTTNFDSFVPTDTPAVIWNGVEKGTSGCRVKAFPKSSGPTIEMVDLGLSVKWAKCNLGAETETDYGDYYAWGEVETKNSYTWTTYTRHTNGTYSSSNKKVFIKYCPTSQESTYWAGTGSADNKLVLDVVDDIVNVQLGGNYRMPTDAECIELLDTTKVTSTWTTKNGVNGREFTSLINGNTLFMPANGFYNGSSLRNAGSNGYYWSSSLNLNNPSNVWYLHFNSNNIYMNSYYRYYGLSIRPVQD